MRINNPVCCTLSEVGVNSSCTLVFTGGSEAVRVPGPTGGERVQVERVGPAVPGLQQD